MAKQVHISRGGPRIELDQEDPTVGDFVTFTITKGGRNPHVQLQMGDRVAFGEDIEYEHIDEGDAEFELPLEGAAIAWLLDRDDEQVVGTLFLVAE